MGGHTMPAYQSAKGTPIHTRKIYRQQALPATGHLRLKE